MRSHALALALACAAGAALPEGAAHAFCGFYVSGADASLYNDATQVVLVREAPRTVLAMANHYQGPPEDFAMVVPVPVVLHEDNVKVLPAELFARLDKLAAPRLVEYWEQDPCYMPKPGEIMLTGPLAGAPAVRRMRRGAPREYGVTIEAKFSVGEYEVVVLSAQDSLGLDAFLRSRHYRIPLGAEPYLRPYVAGGSKFFVAKVNARKVRFENGQAMLSPLRFHYDAETFSLPVRLGLINSAGAQDLVIHVLGRSRYEVANYDNVPVPTNLDVNESVRSGFGAFYAALFDRVLARHPHAVVTEYAWSAGSCDPCPEPPLTPSELATLGADVLPSVADAVASGSVAKEFTRAMTLTRLHVRYGRDSLGEDLVFRAAPPIEGGRGVPGPEGQLARGASPSTSDNFQGRYVIRHPWTGPIACAEPHRGNWGGPPESGQGVGGVQAAVGNAFARQGKVELGVLLAHGEGDLEGGEGKLPAGPIDPPPWPKVTAVRGCASCAVAGESGALPAGALAAAAMAALVARRRRGGRMRAW
jgi:MYXO-CTERM domain-containing protein